MLFLLILSPVKQADNLFCVSRIPIKNDLFQDLKKRSCAASIGYALRLTKVLRRVESMDLIVRPNDEKFITTMPICLLKKGMPIPVFAHLSDLTKCAKSRKRARWNEFAMTGFADELIQKRLPAALLP